MDYSFSLFPRLIGFVFVGKLASAGAVFRTSILWRWKNVKALSVVEPWGTMIANKTKLLEIRTWRPEVLPMLNVALVQNSTRLTKEGDEDMTGQVIAVVDIVSCEPWVKEDCEHSGCDESEFESGWLAWKLSNVRKLGNPVKAIAKRKFYDLADSEATKVKLELRT
ncbi:hypothetical protein ACM6XL_004164 [Vibrio vulnificus]|uniref:hypothetical protein n=1 Tax=Vibrio vulnificus TaxID=672 RepID=UPI0015E13238|nr:hypothetical protein [Vibrio vulnificus]